MAILACSSNANAGVIVDISEVGGDVVVNVSGSIRQLGNLLQTTGGTGPFEVGLGLNSFNIADSSAASKMYTAKFAGLGSDAWGNSPGVYYTSIGSVSGVRHMNYFATNYSGDGLFLLEASYTFGTAITGTGTFVGKTLADLGLTNLGTYQYLVGDFGTVNSDTITFNIGSGGSPVPEPTSACIGLLMLGGGMLRHLRSKKRMLV
jgi:hypothetical protein